MPKSKRNKMVSLTQTKKRPKERKEALVTKVRDAANQYQNVYVFKVANMRNVYLQEVRRRWQESRFFLGKNKVMTIALGRDAASEVHQDLHKLSKRVVGVCGLFFTNAPHEEVTEFFNEYQQQDFPRAGWVANETVQLKAGPLPGFSHAIEPHLRELGLPTKLNFGVIELLRDYDVCVQGRAITPEQAKILKLLGRKLATFSFKLTCWYNVPESRYTSLKSEDEDEDDDAPEGIEQGDDDDE